MSDERAGLRVAFVVANDGVEQVELTKPWSAVVAAGGRPEPVAPEPGPVQARNHFAGPTGSRCTARPRRRAP